MTAQISPSTRTVGFWSAVFATVFSITYDIGQIAEWAGWLGSGGGPESASTPLGLIVLLTPSLFLGSAFLVLMLSVHRLRAAKYGLMQRLHSPRPMRSWSVSRISYSSRW